MNDAMRKSKKRLAVIPTDPIELYLSSGYGAKWLEEYFNPLKYFDEVYVLSPREKDNPDLLGMRAIRTQPAQLRSRLTELSIDVLRAYGGFWPCEMACENKVNGIPVIVSVHDTTPSMLWDPIAKADVVLCMSQAVKKLVLTKHKREGRVWMFQNRIHFDEMRPYTKEEIGDELDKQYPFKHKIIHVGRKTRQKNLDNLIKALKYLGKDYCLLAVGKGDPAEYIQIAKDCGVREQCFFIEAIPNKELARYFSWADCMCMPSRWEGFSIVIIEALAAEAVLVGSNIPEIAEAITHKHNGLLIDDYENPQAIADTIHTACTNPAIRETVKKNARKSVEQFKQSRVDALEVEYYKKVLEMRDHGEFRMPWLERMSSSTVGRNMKRFIPVSMRKAILTAIGR